MKVKVRFRFNKITGEVEMFQVDDAGPAVLPINEHNRLHDQIAAQVGNILERNPLVTEVLPGTESAQVTAATPQTQPIESTTEPVENSPESDKKQRRQGA